MNENFFHTMQHMIAGAAEGVRPPHRTTVPETAAKYRKLNNPGAYTGPWVNETVPYMIEPQEVLTSMDYTAMVFAGPLVSLMQLRGGAHALGVAFAYWCLPQILFYGLYALVGEALNARRVYGPFTWAPIVNNVVSIAGFLVFILLFGSDVTLDAWTPAMIALLAGTATLGIVVQAVILLSFWRRTGLHSAFGWRPIRSPPCWGAASCTWSPTTTPVAATAWNWNCATAPAPCSTCTHPTAYTPT